MASEDDKIYLDGLAEHLGRAVHTIRSWVREEFPDAHGKKLKALMPAREGGRNKIYWVPSQLDALEAYAKERSARRGWQHQAASS